MMCFVKNADIGYGRDPEQTHIQITCTTIQSSRAHVHKLTQFCHLQLVGAGVALHSGKLWSLHFKRTDCRHPGLNPHRDWLFCCCLSVWLEAIKPALKHMTSSNTCKHTASGSQQQQNKAAADASMLKHI